MFYQQKLKKLYKLITMALMSHHILLVQHLSKEVDLARQIENREVTKDLSQIVQAHHEESSSI